MRTTDSAVLTVHYLCRYLGGPGLVETGYWTWELSHKNWLGDVKLLQYLSCMASPGQAILSLEDMASFTCGSFFHILMASASSVWQPLLQATNRIHPRPWADARVVAPQRCMEHFIAPFFSSLFINSTEEKCIFKSSTESYPFNQVTET